MWQAILLTIVFLMILLFGVQNMHQAKVNFPFAGSFEINTIFLLIVCFFLGFATASFIWVGKADTKTE